MLTQKQPISANANLSRRRNSWPVFDIKSFQNEIDIQLNHTNDIALKNSKTFHLNEKQTETKSIKTNSLFTETDLLAEWLRLYIKKRENISAVQNVSNSKQLWCNKTKSNETNHVAFIPLQPLPPSPSSPPPSSSSLRPSSLRSPPPPPPLPYFHFSNAGSAVEVSHKSETKKEAVENKKNADIFLNPKFVPLFEKNVQTLSNSGQITCFINKKKI